MDQKGAVNKGSRFAKEKAKEKASDQTIQQIEYLVHQSTLGVHFMFHRTELLRVLSRPTDDREFFTFDNMAKVQDMLTRFIERPTIIEKQTFLEKLTPEDLELLIRAYFNLVENTILANSRHRH